MKNQYTFLFTVKTWLLIILTIMMIGFFIAFFINIFSEPKKIIVEKEKKVIVEKEKVVYPFYIEEGKTRSIKYFVDGLKYGSPEYTIEYHIYSNAYHKNGYVIIDRIWFSINDPLDIVMKEYKIITKNDAEYINTIHNSLSAKVSDVFTTNIVYLNGKRRADKDFRYHFRVAEAAICINTNHVSCLANEKFVKKAMKRIRGRKYGNQRR